MIIRRIKIMISIVCLFIVSPVFSQGQNNQGSSNGQPFQSLQNQIDNLQAQITAIQADSSNQNQIDSLQGQIGAIAIQLDNSNSPINLAVNCNNGESINGAIASVGSAVNQLNIEITGKCAEQVSLRRSNVHLQGVSTDAEITGNFALIALGGASNISADSLTLVGGNAALACLDGAAVLASHMVLKNSSHGVLAQFGGVCAITDSIVQYNENGITIGSNGVVDAKGLIVQNNSNVAANVYTGGSLTLDASATGASRVSNNRRGLSVFSNGNMRAINVVIENNLGIGINLFSGGTLISENYPGGGLIVRNNNGIGIILQPLSSANFGGKVILNNNVGWDLYCRDVTSAAEVANISGGGNISPSCQF